MENSFERTTAWVVAQLKKELDKRGRMTPKQVLAIVPKEARTGLLLPPAFTETTKRMNIGGRTYYVSQKFYEDYYKSPTNFWRRSNRLG